MSFGTGNAPTNTEFLSVFQDAIRKDVIIVNISQCWMGATATEYAAGKVFIIIFCFDFFFKGLN
jgi:L-asparaginase/Glu-tRNA(Gln) amidotransferase subunit D